MFQLRGKQKHIVIGQHPHQFAVLERAGNLHPLRQPGVLNMPQQPGAGFHRAVAHQLKAHIRQPLSDFDNGMDAFGLDERPGEDDFQRFRRRRFRGRGFRQVGFRRNGDGRGRRQAVGDEGAVDGVGQQRGGFAGVVAQLQDGLVAGLPQSQNPGGPVEDAAVGPAVEPRRRPAAGRQQKGAVQMHHIRHSGPPGQQRRKQIARRPLESQAAIEVHQRKPPGAQRPANLPEYPQIAFQFARRQPRLGKLAVALHPGVHQLELERGRQAALHRHLRPGGQAAGRRGQRRHQQHLYRAIRRRAFRRGRGGRRFGAGHCGVPLPRDCASIWRRRS